MAALPPPTCNALATPAKDAGNAAFAAGRFQEAFDYYSQAIMADPSSALLRSNRAGAAASLGRHVDALADADMCCSLRPDWWKSYTRRGHALFQLGRFDDAEACFREAQLMNPTEPSIGEALERAMQRKTGSGGSSASSAGPPPGTDLRAAGVAGAAPAQVPVQPAWAPQAAAATATRQADSLPTDFQKLSEKEMRQRLEESVAKLSDAQLEQELHNAGIQFAPGASRADKVQLFMKAPGVPGGVAAKPAEKKKPFMAKFSSGGDGPTRGDNLMERRKKWVEEWSTWDEAKLLDRLFKLGVDATGNPRAVLIDLLLEAETERVNRQRCTPKRLQFIGVFSAAAAIMGTFVVVALVFALGGSPQEG